MGRVHGVENVTSTSRSGQSQVEVAFRRDVDIDFGRVELNEELGAVLQVREADLPDVRTLLEQLGQKPMKIEIVSVPTAAAKICGGLTASP